MALEVVRSDAALADIFEIVDFLTDAAGEDLALRFAAQLQTRLENLAEAPGMGVVRDYTRPELAGLRMASVPGFPSHLIYYQATGQQLLIRRVLHGARDVAQILSDTVE